MNFRYTYRTIRGFLFSFLNKELLVFLFFLALSAGFWLVMALNDTYEREIAVPVKIVAVADRIVITEGLPDTVKVVVRDKGYTLLSYEYVDEISPVCVSFSMYARMNGRGTVPMADFQKLLYQQLYASTKIVSVKADKLEFFFNYGISKRVPLLLDANIRPAESYYLAKKEVFPDSVTIFAAASKLDSIQEVYTEQLEVEGLSDTLEYKLRTKKIRGVKILPETVKVFLYPDVLTEKVISVPIMPLNMPEGYRLRIFPSSVHMKVVAGRTKISSIRPEHFQVVADYKEILKNPSDKCNLHILLMPQGVMSATLQEQQVDYLIENVQ